jgi:hypothetical protein
VPILSVIVPATDRPPTLARCLAAIEAAGDPPGEVIVVDGPSTASPAAARNVGARRATGDVLVFVDADVEVHDDVFSRIRAVFAADSVPTAVFGSYDDDPAAPGAVSSFRNLLHHHVHQASPGPASTFWAGLGAIRREAFEEAGGFVEHPVEDIELGMRLVEDGARIVLDPSIQGKHLKAWTLGGMVRTDFAVRGVPWVGLLLRHRGSVGHLNLGWRHRLSALAAIGLAGSIVMRRMTPAAASLAALVALNRSFYGLLLRRRGPIEACAGVGLHVVHHLTGVAALPVGVLAYLREGAPRNNDPIDDAPDEA